MLPRWTARLVSLAALLPLLALAVAGGGYDRFRCAFTGEVTETGCCPAEDPPVQPVANAASCCDHESGRVERAPAEETAAHAVAVPAYALATTVGDAGPALPPARAGAPHASAQAPPSPPLRLVKQSFLI
jgi:hypothetical protein